MIIVIGTHRLLQTGVLEAIWGLVDEEQRFGVATAIISLLRTHVDVLTMSATPDPGRTLEMSLADLRDADHPDARRLRHRRDLRRTAPSATPRRCAGSRCATGSMFYVTLDRRGRRLRSWCPRRGWWNKWAEFEDLLETTATVLGTADILVSCTIIVEDRPGHLQRRTL